MTSIEHTPVAGQVAVVTGGGRGIGRAIALSLADAGASVAVLARSAAEIDEVAGQVERGGGTAFAATVDVTDQESVRSAMDAVTDQLGTVDLLVNNAGSNAAVGPAWEVDPGQWWWDVTVNLLGPFLCARAVLASMVERARGRIVNVASGTAGRAFPFDTAYACSKAALVRLTDSLAAETRDHGVSVFALSPGNVDTRLNREVRESEAGQRWMGDVWENMPPSISAGVAAGAVVFLAGGEGDALSGRWLDARQDLAALASRCPGPLAVDVGDPDGGASRREGQHSPASETAATASDDGDPIGEPGHQAVGPARCTLASDLGSTDAHPKPVAGLHDHLERLWREGASEQDLRVMVCDNPARLLGLDS